MKAELELPSHFGVGWDYERHMLASALPDGGGFGMVKRCNFAKDDLEEVIASAGGKVIEFRPGSDVRVEVEFAEQHQLLTIEAALENLVSRFVVAPAGVEFRVTEVVPGMLFGQALAVLGSGDPDAPAMPLASFMSAYLPAHHP